MAALTVLAGQLGGCVAELLLTVTNPVCSWKPAFLMSVH
jgi:hypothetical protein